ncbi:MAG: hypothetical protein K9K64_02825 [Desulfohalobiaceae bacterium]|nr:hypothetical protein [Desulfohalobiaceae bacterium]
MPHLKDALLLAVILLATGTGILFPRVGAVFQPALLYLLMGLLFLSFTSIDISSIWSIMKDRPLLIAWVAACKLLFLPVLVFAIFSLIWPDFALSALLLSGISTGVVAPFIARIVGGNVSLVLVLVIVTSLLVPFSLPVMVKVLAAETIVIPLLNMVRMLCLVIFVPIGLVEGLRRFWPRSVKVLSGWTFPLSLAIIGLINLGVFSKYSEFFHQHPLTIAEAVAAAMLLGLIYLLSGSLIVWPKSLPVHVASCISLCNINNVLVIVFAAQFFGPREPTVAAMYMIPFFLIILPLRAMQRAHHKGA